MKTIVATFDADTRRCHRFIINEGQGTKGTLYFTKGEDIPDSVTIYLKTKGQTVQRKQDGESQVAWDGLGMGGAKEEMEKAPA